MSTTVTVEPRADATEHATSQPDGAPGGVAPAGLTSRDASAASWRRQQVAQLAALALMCGIFFGGAGAVVWYVYGGADRVPAGETLLDLPADRGIMGALRRGGQPRPQPPAPVIRDGVRKSGNNSFSARAGDTTLYASRSAKGEWILRFGYATPKFTSPEQPALLTAKYNSKLLGLTEDQLKRLNALPAFGGMAIAQADRDQLQSLWNNYASATDDKVRADAERAHVTAPPDAGKRSLEPTRAAIAEHVEKIRAILTPEQVAKLQPGARR